MLERKTSLLLGLILGALIGDLIPGLWDTNFFDLTAFIWAAVGAVIGLYVAHRLSE